VEDRNQLTAEVIDSVKTQTKMEAAIFMVSSCRGAIFRYRVLKTSDRGIMATCGSNSKSARDNVFLRVCENACLNCRKVDTGSRSFPHIIISFYIRVTLIGGDPFGACIKVTSGDRGGEVRQRSSCRAARWPLQGQRCLWNRPPSSKWGRRKWSAWGEGPPKRTTLTCHE
jgi:hypothetical protein